jgi:hypothetical protein
MKPSQRPLFFLVAVVSGLVLTVGCGGKVIVSGQGGSQTSTDTTTSSDTTTTTIACTEGPDCVTGIPSPGSPCQVPGTCCSYWMCDHMGGEDSTTVYCGDAGTWEW